MSEAAVGSVQDELALVRAGRENVTLLDIFIEFLIIGATSFGGVVPYLRNNLVTKKHWVDDKEFVQLLSISQTLPGLNATNVAILLGDRLKGWLGALVAIVGVCLPGATAPVSIGLLLAGTLSMARGAVTGWTTGGVALAVLLILLWRKANPALLVVGGAIVGALVYR